MLSQVNYLAHHQSVMCAVQKLYRPSYTSIFSEDSVLSPKIAYLRRSSPHLSRISLLLFHVERTYAGHATIVPTPRPARGHAHARTMPYAISMPCCNAAGTPLPPRSTKVAYWCVASSPCHSGPYLSLPISHSYLSHTNPEKFRRKSEKWPLGKLYIHTGVYIHRAVCLSCAPR